MIDRRNVLRGAGAAALGALAVTAVTSGTDLAAATTGDRELFGDPASTPQAESLWPAHLTDTERKHLKVFDELDFVVYSGQQWDRIAINMATVGIWNKNGVMEEEFLFWDNPTFYQQIGLA